MKQAFSDHRRGYGTRRLRAELHAQGYRIGRQRLRTAMRRHGLRALQPRAYTPRTTDSAHGLRCAPNRLLDQPKPTQVNQVWVSDITYLPLASGQWAYLCAFQDACTRQVVGWRVLDTMPEELVTSALRQALLARQPAPACSCTRTAGDSIAPTLTVSCSTSTSVCARRVAGTSAWITRRPRASGRGSKRRSWGRASGLLSATWPTRSIA